jgi:amino acid transporter
MHDPHAFCLASAGVFFLAGLVSGAWKYACIARSPEAKAPFYVDTAHRASLLYAFACALLGAFVNRSAWSDAVNLSACATLIAYFAISVLGYIVHGALRDTDNQLQRPHRLGRRTVPAVAMTAFMLSLIAVEVSAFGLIFAGWLAST